MTTQHPWSQIQHPKDFARWAALHGAERKQIETRYKKTRRDYYKRPPLDRVPADIAVRPA